MIRLTIVKPDKPPEVVLYDKPIEVTIGRSSRCAITLDSDPMVSRTHATLLLNPSTPPSALIRDDNSTNGIRVNGEPYGQDASRNAYDPVALRDGDEVSVGATLLRIELSAVPDSGAGTDVLPAPAPSPAPDARQRPRSSRRSVTRDNDATGRYSAEDTVSSAVSAPPRVPGYRLIRYLATGAAGKVYLGVSNGGERPVAVKVMHPPSGLTQAALRVFFREFDDARHVVHPRLARLLGAGELSKGGGVFVAAEYAEGDNLSLYMRRQPGGRLPPETALEIATQIAGAVCRVHKRGLTHLDLKPSSVIVAENGGRVAAKVTDTGLTVFLEMAGLLPRWGSGTGKPGFFAPERLFPEGKAGKAADVFSVCALLLFMLAGHTPEALGSIVKKGLSANPDERFADACELAAALERVAR